MNQVTRSFFQRQKQEITLLFRSIPGSVLALFVVSVVGMNLLANKSLDIPLPHFALDAGILLSWVSFLSMDMITKHFGPKAANQVAVFAVLVNLGMSLVFFLAALLPGMWGESYVEGSEDLLNAALNHTFAGQWYVLLGSTVAFLVSAIVNNLLSWAIGKAAKKDNAFVFYLRSYVSTAVGQFVDNLVFSLIVSVAFFGWTIPQVFVCASLGMVAELLMEVLFSPIGYHVSKKWKAAGVGKDYLALMQTPWRNNA